MKTRIAVLATGSVAWWGISGSLIAVDVAFGEERWRVPTGGPAWSAPVVADGVVYVAGPDGNVLAVEEATGRERWRISLGDRALGVALAGGVVYAGGSDGSVVALGDGCGEPAGIRVGCRVVAPVGGYQKAAVARALRPRRAGPTTRSVPAKGGRPCPSAASC